MKPAIEIPSADDVRNVQTNILQATHQATAEACIKWMNTKLKLALANAAQSPHAKGVNVPVPFEAYNNPYFYIFAQDALKRLGFNSEKSHDGGGMEATLYVTWK